MAAIRTIITGATGMVEAGVLHECLHPDVKESLLLQRRSSGIAYPKLKELIHPDFFHFLQSPISLTGYEAASLHRHAFVGRIKDDYYRLTCSCIDRNIRISCSNRLIFLKILNER